MPINNEVYIPRQKSVETKINFRSLINISVLIPPMDHKWKIKKRLPKRPFFIFIYWVSNFYRQLLSLCIPLRILPFSVRSQWDICIYTNKEYIKKKNFLSLIK